MALTAGTSGGDFIDSKLLANEGASVIYKIRGDGGPMYLEQSKKEVQTVLVDTLVLTGSMAGRVVRGEKPIGNGILPALQRQAMGADAVFTYSWKDSQYGKPFPAIDAPSAEVFAYAEQVFQASGGDPYSAAERAAAPTASLVPGQTAAPVQQAAPPVQAAPPAYAPPAAAPPVAAPVQAAPPAYVAAPETVPAQAAPAAYAPPAAAPPVQAAPPAATPLPATPPWLGSQAAGIPA